MVAMNQPAAIGYSYDEWQIGQRDVTGRRVVAVTYMLGCLIGVCIFAAAFSSLLSQLAGSSSQASLRLFLCMLGWLWMASGIGIHYFLWAEF